MRVSGSREEEMATALENAEALYERGIPADALDEVPSTYMGETYTRHSTGVPTFGAVC